MTGPEAPATGQPGSGPGWHPPVRWLRRWGISIASLVGGFLTLFVFQRELTHVRWIVGYLLLLWLLFALVTQVRQTLQASQQRTARLAITAADYTMQSLYHGVLLFLLPAYWASTTLTSGNAAFLGVLVVLALLATFDPWYQALVHPRPWVGSIFFLVSIFGTLNVALPLVGVPPYLALLASAAIAAFALTPALVRAQGWGWLESLGATTLAAVAAMTLAHASRALIPPAPMSLARAVLAWDVGSVSSLEPDERGIKADEMRARGLVAYTAVYAPAGLSQEIRHVWRRDGELVDVVKLSPVHGGRRGGFRTFSRKTAFPADPTGRWSIDVVTSSGQLIGRLRFTVTP